MFNVFANSLGNGSPCLIDFAKSLRNGISFLSEFANSLGKGIPFLSEFALSPRHGQDAVHATRRTQRLDC